MEIVSPGMMYFALNLILIGGFILGTQVSATFTFCKTYLHFCDHLILELIFIATDYLQALKGQDFPIPSEELYEDYK